jgi:hypothetical protein
MILCELSGLVKVQQVKCATVFGMQGKGGALLSSRCWPPAP